MRTLPRVPSAKAANASGARSSGTAVSTLTRISPLAAWSSRVASLSAVAAAMTAATVTSARATSSALAPRVEASVPPALRVLPSAAASPGGVQDLVDPLRRDRQACGGDVAGVVDGVRRTEAADVVVLLTRAGGADDGRAGGRRELRPDRADSAGCAGDEHRFAG